MENLRNKIDYYWNGITEEDNIDLMSDFEEFIVLNVINKLQNPTEDVAYVFSVLNELANLKEDKVDELLETCVYINLWSEYINHREYYWHYLNKRSKKLHNEAVFLYTNGATLQEQIQYRKRNGL